MSSFFRRRPNPEEPDTDEDDDAGIDPELRLRTVRTAASTIAESIRSEARMQRRRSKRMSRTTFFGKSPALRTPGEIAQGQQGDVSGEPAKPKGKRRNIYINMTPDAADVDANGEPLTTYVRNKVRTSKYTIITFVPKNLFEQFRRVANIYFLVLVILQVFPVFGAATAPALAAFPLLFILTVTAIKDGIEDYRRAKLDDEVNNSPVTKLGQWRNVNVSLDPRPWFEKLFGINKPGIVTKGVRKLREREAMEGRITLEKAIAADVSSDSIGPQQREMQRVRSLEDIQSIQSDDHQYPPVASIASTSATAVSIGPPPDEVGRLPFGSSAASVQMSVRSIRSQGVVDWNRRTPGTARWERTLWKKLEVGDVVLLRDNEQVPADVIVLSTSDADGLCYVETKNLDGETNLKPRKSLRATSSISSEEDIEHASFMVDSEAPHVNLYLHNGVLRYMGPPDAQSPEAVQGGIVPRVEPITINELLLRGTTIRNTNWVIAMVVYTGADTKIMLNGGDTPSKRSKIEKETNFNVIMNFVILLLMCITTAVLSGYFDTMTNTSAASFEVGAEWTDSVVLNSLITFASCLIVFQNIVPISLYISIEIVKTIQAYFISQDIDMYYEPYDTACQPKTWNISDDLGQIEYVFSDKTGTLTQNVMEFQKCSVGGIAYGEGITEAMRGAARREGREMVDPEEQSAQIAELKETMINAMTRTFKNRYLRSDQLTLISPKLAEDLADRSSPQRARIISFFRALALCHTVLSDRPDARERPFTLDYKAESPDEAALVAAARDVGFPFVNRTSTAADIEVMGQAERYTPLRVLEFNSTRKRMSVIVRNPEGRLILYCKGADSVIYARLAADHDPVIKESTTRDLELFANSGLRTLCISYRYLTDEEFFEWARIHDAATSAVENREEKIDEANELIEKNLTILGATALEDKLQEGVPAAIQQLHEAGIKLWILTGDKLQTAIEIGFSCNLLKNDMEIMILSADNADAARSQIEAGLNKIASILGISQFKEGAPKKTGGFAVVIDGDTLRYALDESLKPLFLNLGTQCDTVVCCRVSPAQKALTVKLVKDGRNAMTLSIGDGANDVAMIQEAHVGCGLLGLEGSQAAMSADYAFGQFRFLTKLLLVHGRWSYVRIADMHSNFFYKNVIWTFAMFWYLPWNSFDATYLYEYTFILLYNLVFTSLPVIVLGAFDQDINAKASLAFPQLYYRGILGLEYTRTKFWIYMLDGLYQSAVVYFIAYISFTSGLSTSWSGKTLDSLADFGTTIAVSAIFSANLFVGMNTRYWTLITWIVTFGSMLALLIWIAIYSFFRSLSFNDEIIVLFSTVSFWTTVILSIILAIGPRFIFKFVAQAFFPMDKDIVREMWVVGDLKDQLGIEHRRDKRRKPRDPESGEDRSLFTPHLRAGSLEMEREHYEPVPITATGLPQSASPTPTPAPPLVSVSGPEGQPGHLQQDFLPPRLHHERDIPSQISYYSASDIPFSNSPVPHAQPATRSPPVSPRHPPGLGGEFEMNVRSGTSHPSTPHGHTFARGESQASNLSFTTADEGHNWEYDDNATARQGYRDSTYSIPPHAM